MTEPSEAGEDDLDTGPVRLPGSGGYEDAPTPPSGSPAAWPHAVSPLLPPFPLPPPPPMPAAPPPPVSPAPLAPAPVSPTPLPPLGSPRTERESVVALFLVHMFPIGHLPVAMDKPARQLPLPEDDPEGFGPNDHPDARLIFDDQALTNVTAGFRRSPTAPSRPVPRHLTDGYVPYAHATQAVWIRRFVVGHSDLGPEYAWPPGDHYPEGSVDHGEPVMVPMNTVLDRFGPAHGRVFFADGTPFAERSLPPGMLDAEYRRYVVVRAVPMWRAETANWFGQVGGGTRYRALLAADELVTLGYLAEAKGEED
ncbi:TNT domain-containing protein [Amycolatopsis sp. FBCC-B4732]|uniref:TNT domain-containing protein n=1 Tax=Amycolatopsis sp. FBCC-B4732 TaxID=3079339 RepID=UPI001FF12869|nr:TNT domain-containing protein [Amycolatopsis sp. FBCC-B4732]UOX86340.1 TNT domain-containing protein [Amycolatopsis sp. FBCC-B4732]